MATRRDYHLDQPRRRSSLAQQASQDRLKVLADLNRPQLARGILADLFGFMDDGTRHD